MSGHDVHGLVAADDAQRFFALTGAGPNKQWQDFGPELVEFTLAAEHPYQMDEPCTGAAKEGLVFVSYRDLDGDDGKQMLVSTGDGTLHVAYLDAEGWPVAALDKDGNVKEPGRLAAAAAGKAEDYVRGLHKED